MSAMESNGIDTTTRFPHCQLGNRDWYKYDRVMLDHTKLNKALIVTYLLELE